MRFSAAIIAMSTFLPGILAFKCASGWYGECYYDHTNSDGTATRCALKCTSGPVNVECHCPDTYPGQPWPYTGKHECITIGKYNGRHHCYA
ncbi:hypothetical protein B0T26DRAFT_713683 [Lasiosphaeria miniovina]|uniref:Extracellular membrane protein CFEM domain-containing protein n=1 Tax=Lasiosphaeria miniovina TaxID=1954250 RepID=A0AA40E0W6_9PEZI|nr:uncharacterized protein B0T26DRAFT_713683 [Lasiosphaeria miniovina]KAK0718593.1 hypothetical protein B0T26DRAFT_713683 [Lasiosphaeria miniovina]